MSTIWRVYAILLEYSCKTDYELMISEVSRQFQEENVKLKTKIEEMHLSNLEKHEIILQKYEDAKATAEASEKKTEMYVKHIEKLNEYIEDLRRRNEEEINIRKQFEAKLNELHSIGRDQDSKYFRAIEEIDHYMQRYEASDKDLKKLEKETMDLRKIKITLETEVINLDNK